MSKIRLKQIDNLEISGYIKNVTSGDLATISGTLSGLTTSGLALSGAFGDLYNSFDTISGDISSISGRLNVIEADFADFDIYVSAVSGELVNTNASLATVSGDLDFAEGRLDVVETDIDTLVDDVYTLQTGLAAVTGNVATISGRVTTLSGHVVTTSGLVNTLSGNVATATGTINTRHSDLSGSYTGFTGGYINNRVVLYSMTGSGVNGPTMSANTWLDRHMNIKAFDSGNLCTLNGTNFLLSGGTYEVDAYAIGYNANSAHHRAVLYNYSSGSQSGVLVTGSSLYTQSPTAASVASIVKGIFTLPNTGAILAIRHIMSDNGYGGVAAALNDNISSGLFCQATFTKIA